MPRYFASVEQCFRGTTSRIMGTNFDDLWSDQRALAKAAWDPRQTIDQGGLYKYVHGGEYHCYNPDVISTLQAAVQTGDYSKYEEYAALVNNRPVATLRDLMETKAVGKPVPLDEVESVEAIPASKFNGIIAELKRIQEGKNAG